MSFRCGVCNVPQHHGAKPHILPIGIKEVKHPSVPAKRSNNYVSYPGGKGTGWEGQVQVCDSCNEQVISTAMPNAG